MNQSWCVHRIGILASASNRGSMCMELLPICIVSSHSAKQWWPLTGGTAYFIACIYSKFRFVETLYWWNIYICIYFHIFAFCVAFNTDIVVVNGIFVTCSCGLFYWHGLTLISARIGNYIPDKMRSEITYPFLNSQTSTVQPLKFWNG